MPFSIENMSKEEIRSFSYQKFVKDFLRCAASIDDNLQKIIDHLKESKLGTLGILLKPIAFNLILKAYKTEKYSTLKAYKTN